MTAIFKKEFRSYFTSFLGYVFIAVFLVFFSYNFFTVNVLYGVSNFHYDFLFLLPVLLFLIPAVTAKLFAEDRKTKADQLLFTAPVSQTEIVLGKFFAATAFFGVTLLGTFIYPIMLSFFTTLYWPIILNSYFGFFMVGIAVISICMFMSSTTANQTIAFILGFGSSLFLWLVESQQQALSEGVFKQIMGFVTIIRQYEDFASGALKLSLFVYYLSVAGLFILFTIRSLEKRRRRG